MNKEKSMKTKLLLSLSALYVCTSSLLAVEKPNIIMILSDDVGLGNISACGADNFKTPNIDALAKNGLRFAQCYAMPQCSPSRCTMLTGRYPFRTGMIFNNTKPPINPKKEVMIQTVMKQAGYVTASIGKWHLPLTPGEWGYDEYLSTSSGSYWNDKTKFYNVNGKKEALLDGQYLPDIMHGYIVNFLTKNKDNPFFLSYPMIHIHSPISRTPDSKPGGDEARLYADNVEYMDKLVGKLVAELDRLHLREKTLVIFAGDNGTSGGPSSTATVNGRKLIGNKIKLQEGGSRVPLICNWRGVTPAGKVLNDLVDFSDFFTTFADLGGAKLPEGVKQDSHSFAPQLRGAKGTPRDWVFAQLRDNWYVRDQGFKLTSGGELFDMSDAPFDEKPSTNEAARTKLQAILKKLNPTVSNPKGTIIETNAMETNNLVLINPIEDEK